MAESRVNVEDEQLLLKTYSDALAKEREKDPRAAFAVRPNADGASGFGASLVGPMGSAGMNLASVEKAMGRDREGDNEGPSSAAAAAAARRASAVSMARQVRLAFSPDVVRWLSFTCSHSLARRAELDPIEPHHLTSPLPQPRFCSHLFQLKRARHGFSEHVTAPRRAADARHARVDRVGLGAE